MLALAHFAVLGGRLNHSQGVVYVLALAHFAVLRWKAQSFLRSSLCACLGPLCCVEVEG